jgi:DNA-binding transcriptional ArsR family regulator
MQFKTLVPKTKKAALVFRAINNRFRQNILQFILDNPKVRVTVICSKLHMEQSVVSQHLAVLRNQKIVIPNRDGKFIYYSVDQDRLQQIEQAADQLICNLKDYPERV